MPTHYETLGISPAATPDEVRRAYHERARRLHPDRLLDVSPAELARAEHRMREVNEAWRVLRDPGRRARYDRSLSPVADLAARDDEEAEDEIVAPRFVRGLPWFVLIGVMVAIFVFTAYAAGGRATPDPTTTSVALGACIGTLPGSVTTSLPCDAPSARVIVALVAHDTDCPAGTARVRVFDQLDSLCLRP